jgi:hypothetical protein
MGVSHVVGLRQHGSETWRPRDSAAAGLVLLMAGLWWAAISIISGAVALYARVTRPLTADDDASDEL